MKYNSQSVYPISPPSWYRSDENRWIFGVCGGLAERLKVDPLLVRALWLLALLAYGTGALLYLVLAIALPAKRDLPQSQSPKILGVCANLSRRWNVDVGWLRVGAIFAGIASFGIALVVYLILYVVMDDYQPERETEEGSIQGSRF